MDREAVALGDSARGGCRCPATTTRPADRRVAAGDHLEQRGLAGAVGPHDADDLRARRRRSRRRARTSAARRAGRACRRLRSPSTTSSGVGSSCSRPSSCRAARRRRAAPPPGRSSDDAAEVEHVDAVGDRRARCRRSARRRATATPSSLAGGGSCAARPARSWARGPGSARRTARGRARRAARAQIATICISPPERFSHSRCIRYSSGEKMSKHVLRRVQARKRRALARDREIAWRR